MDGKGRGGAEVFLAQTRVRLTISKQDFLREDLQTVHELQPSRLLTDPSAPPPTHPSAFPTELSGNLRWQSQIALDSLGESPRPRRSSASSMHLENLTSFQRHLLSLTGRAVRSRNRRDSAYDGAFSCYALVPFHVYESQRESASIVWWERGGAERGSAKGKEAKAQP